MVKSNFIVTGAQYAARPNQNFLRSLESLATDRNAQILILPLQGKTIHEQYEVGLHDVLEAYPVVGGKYKLNNKIRIGDFEVRPNQRNPLTGLSGFAQTDVSMIIPSPKQHLEIIPNSNMKLPKALMSTGVVTMPNYREHFRINKIAKDEHTYGAIFVEIVDGTNFHYRPLQAGQNGKFHDLGRKYDGEKDPEPGRLEALVLGDLHVGDTDIQAYEASMDQIATYAPSRVVLHDFFNGHSVNHHIEKDAITRAQYASRGRESLEAELVLGAKTLDEIVDASNGAQILIVASNHHDFLRRYLTEGKFMNDPENTRIGAKLLADAIDGVDPVQAGLAMFTTIPDNVHFLTRNDDYKVRGWNLSNHGDMGGNGAKGSPRQFAKMYGKSIVGHRHTPFIWRDIYGVGTNTELRLDYTRGPSGWMHTNAFLYPDSKVQLVNTIAGDYGTK